MKFMNTLRCKIVVRSCLLLFFLSLQAQKPPKLTVIFVIDQFAHHYISHIKPYLKGGLKLLFDQGIYFDNAYFPHAMPGTAIGHVGLNTGSFAHYHGIIGNSWVTPENILVECDDDTQERAAVFSPDGFYDYGKSANNTHVDGISEQFMLHPKAQTPHHVYAISIKSRAAISAANKLGKAIWFDDQSGSFTSSKAYFDALPTWLTGFNKSHKPKPEKTWWQPLYSLNDNAYASHDPNTYQFTRRHESLFIQPLSSDDPEKPYQLFLRSPHANKLLLDLAAHIINNHINRRKKDEMILWVCISGLDHVGHIYGPNSFEILDMIYQLDRQLRTFIKHAQKRAGKKNILFVLTGDHGVSPIIECLQKKGMTNAHRLDAEELIHEINTFINTRHGINNLVLHYKNPQFYCDTNKLRSLKKNKQKEIFNDIKAFLLKKTGIKQVWTYDELTHSYFESETIESFFKKQLFPSRSGQIIVQTFPYNIITKWAEGTSHKTPYEVNTHVPLVLYLPGVFEQKLVKDKVWVLQLANTLAEILEIPKPSTSTFKLLPHVFVDPPGF